METLEQTRERFETWFKMTYPLWRDDLMEKHRLWTNWQVAYAPAPVEPQLRDGHTSPTNSQEGAKF